MDDFGLSDIAIEWITLWMEVRRLETGDRIEFGEACRDYFIMMRNRGRTEKFLTKKRSSTKI